MDEFAQEFTDACHKGGYIKEEDIDWIIDLIGDTWETLGPRGACLRLRKYHTLMDYDDLKAAGLRGNVMFSYKTYDVLTAKGRKNPIQAIEETLSHATRMVYSGRRAIRQQRRAGYAINGRGHMTPRCKPNLPG